MTTDLTIPPNRPVRRKRTYGLRGCSGRAAVVLRWPWSASPLALCAEHWPDLADRGMVAHDLSSAYIAGAASAAPLLADNAQAGER